MNFILWILQFFLAVLFSFVGFIKSFWPVPELSNMLPWVSALPEEVIRFIGACELLGAAGLLLPLVIRHILVHLPVIASLCLGLVMVNAAVFHAFRGEYASIIINIIILIITIFVAYGRWKIAPLYARRKDDW